MIRGRRFFFWLFANPEAPVSRLRVLVWWELRRIPFNLIIGAYGLVCLTVTIAAIVTSGHLGPGEDAVEPIAVVAAPFVVNILYTLGSVVELAARDLRPGVVPPRFGPWLFGLGLGFGLFMLTIPAVLWSGFRLIQWAGLAS